MHTQAANCHAVRLGAFTHTRPTCVFPHSVLPSWPPPTQTVATRTACWRRLRLRGDFNLCEVKLAMLSWRLELGGTRVRHYAVSPNWICSLGCFFLKQQTKETDRTSETNRMLDLLLSDFARRLRSALERQLSSHFIPPPYPSVGLHVPPIIAKYSFIITFAT